MLGFELFYLCCVLLCFSLNQARFRMASNMRTNQFVSLGFDSVRTSFLDSSVGRMSQWVKKPAG